MTTAALRESVALAVLAGALGVACSSSGGANPDAGRAGGHGGAAGVDAGGAGGTAGQGGGGPTTPGDSVLTYHNHLNRDGVFLQPSLTKVAAAGLHPDSAFRVNFVGAVLAQPLYVDNGPGGTDLLIVATEADVVYAFDASSGQQVWSQTLGTPVPLADMPCGNLDPLGITGTPVIDLASRTLFVTAMSTPDSGSTKQYGVYALSIDDGTVRSGWPIDVASALAAVGAKFTASFQGQRAALTIVNGVLYVPFGGLAGDCGNYRGWVVAIPLSNPQGLAAWSTGGPGGGIWAPGGAASDGASIFVATGNTVGVTDWAGGEAVFGFPASLPLATTPSYWAPAEWYTLDKSDFDLGAAGPIVFDLPGATPSHLAVVLGKSNIAYLLDPNNLGGITDALSSIEAATDHPAGAHVVYSTATATYLAFNAKGPTCTGANAGSELTALVLVPGSPPHFGGSWCAGAVGAGSPIVTTTDGQADAIVWAVASDRNDMLQGFDGDTGATIFAGGDTSILGVRHFVVPIAAKGRIFVAADNTVVAFTP